VIPECTKAAQANGPGIKSRSKGARSTLEPCLGFKKHRALWDELLNEVRRDWIEARGIGFFAERIEASAPQVEATAGGL
jgi:hypothetical protein